MTQANKCIIAQATKTTQTSDVGLNLVSAVNIENKDAVRVTFAFKVVHVPIDATERYIARFPVFLWNSSVSRYRAWIDMKVANTTNKVKFRFNIYETTAGSDYSSTVEIDLNEWYFISFEMRYGIAPLQSDSRYIGIQCFSDASFNTLVLSHSKTFGTDADDIISVNVYCYEPYSLMSYGDSFLIYIGPFLYYSSTSTLIYLNAAKFYDDANWKYFTIASSMSAYFKISSIMPYDIIKDDSAEINAIVVTKPTHSNLSGGSIASYFTTAALGYANILDEILTIDEVSFSSVPIIGPGLELICNDFLIPIFEALTDGMISGLYAIVKNSAYFIEDIIIAIGDLLCDLGDDFLNYLGRLWNALQGFVTVNDKKSADWLKNLINEIDSFIDAPRLIGIPKKMKVSSSAPEIPFKFTFGGANIHISKILGPLADINDPLFSKLDTCDTPGSYPAWYSGKTDGNVTFGDTWPYWVSMPFLIYFGIAAPDILKAILSGLGAAFKKNYAKETYEMVKHGTYGVEAIKTAINSVSSKVDTVDGVVDSNYNLLSSGSYGLSVIKTAIDSVSSNLTIVKGYLENETYGLNALQNELTTILEDTADIISDLSTVLSEVNDQVTPGKLKEIVVDIQDSLNMEGETEVGALLEGTYTILTDLDDFMRSWTAYLNDPRHNPRPE